MTNQSGFISGLSLRSLVLLALLAAPVSAPAEQAKVLDRVLDEFPLAPPGYTLPPLAEKKLQYQTDEGLDIEVQVMAKGLEHPWGIASLPDGSLLVTERSKGQLRLIRNGILDPRPLAAMPEIACEGYYGLHDVILHPDFVHNQRLYLSYHKKLAGGEVVLAVLRATLKHHTLHEPEDIFLADPEVTGSFSLYFDEKRMLYISLSGKSEQARDLSTLRGKVLRLREDGSVPDDNPFVDTPGARPEIFSVGQRNTQGLMQRPDGRDLRQEGMGGKAGDNRGFYKAGSNNGWLQAGLGRDDAGPWQKKYLQAGKADSAVYWMPSVSVSGMTVYHGDKLPEWRGDVFVAGRQSAGGPGSAQLQRIRFNGFGREVRREALLDDLNYRIRGIHQDAEGYLYVLLDEDRGAVLRIGPAPEGDS